MTSVQPSIEVWAGIECALVRLGDRYVDQLERNGHATRYDDLDRISTLGVRTVRYPILWERTAPAALEDADWTWADERLVGLRTRGIRPIVGLVHHGSGPLYTSLVDPDFPLALARFARAVAERYPWVEDYTPVNEPLTTARFSGLYGHWYPHGHDDATFVRALLTQCRAVVLAMRAIRTVTPGARLVQTEDLGKTFSTPALAYQADFENERRWLTMELLHGRIGPEHALWRYLLGAGAVPDELEWFQRNPCPPDVLGINYYPTSDRFLDQDLAAYPPSSLGGNAYHAYADVEAMRVCSVDLIGHRVRLSEAWQRYHLPLAVTEAHIACTREEQMRWLCEAWDAAMTLRQQGADIRAVTLWSLFGAYDWGSLLTRQDNAYEPGVFDLRAPRPRATALAQMARQMSTGRPPDHPVLAVPGWWRRPIRHLYDQTQAASQHRPAWTLQDVGTPRAQPLLIIGVATALNQLIAQLCHLRGLAYRLLSHVDITGSNSRGLADALDHFAPWGVIDTTLPVRPSATEAGDERWRGGRLASATTLASACSRRRLALLTFSSHEVFDGAKAAPYVESDPVTPFSAAGHAQAAIDAAVHGAYSSALIARSGPLFGSCLCTGAGFVSAEMSDAVVSPTFAPDFVHACLDLLVDGEGGVWHMANAGAIAWPTFVQCLADATSVQLGAANTPPVNLRQARQPAYQVLASERGTLLPSLNDAWGRYTEECQRIGQGTPTTLLRRSG